MIQILLFVSIIGNLSCFASEGKRIYMTSCAKCHNTNPSKPGVIGPDIANSSLELITLKTQKREYPKGYKPKRKTKIMPIIKLSSSQITALHEYISSFNKK